MVARGVAVRDNNGLQYTRRASLIMPDAYIPTMLTSFSCGLHLVGLCYYQNTAVHASVSTFITPMVEGDVNNYGIITEYARDAQRTLNVHRFIRP